MATHKVSELDGAMLDRAVAIALGWCECATPDRPHEGPLCWQFGPDSNFHIIKKKQWRPHADWGQAGPLIERERIAVSPNGTGRWAATCPCEGAQFSTASGARPLIAALRAFVESRLGEEIELP